MNEIERVKTRRVFGNAVSGDFTEYTDYKLREDYRLMTELDRYLGKVEGQAYACQQVKEYLFGHLRRRNVKGPAGLLVFAGPPAVGKTFMAEQIAKALHRPFDRYDMSGYAEKESLDSLCGTHPSYKSASAGRLTRFLYDHPVSVIQLDEIEKAYSLVHNLLLQLLENGTIRDLYMDKEISARDAIIIITTNVGKEIYDRGNGQYDFSRTPLGTIVKAFENECSPLTGTPYFSQAIVSRLASGRMIMFNKLRPEVLHRIAVNAVRDQIESYREQYRLTVCADVHRLADTIILSQGAADIRTVLRAVKEFFERNFTRMVQRFHEETGTFLFRQINCRLDFSDISPEAAKIYFHRSKARLLVYGVAEGDLPAVDDRTEVICLDGNADLCKLRYHDGSAAVINIGDGGDAFAPKLFQALVDLGLPVYVCSRGRLPDSAFLFYTDHGAVDCFSLSEDGDGMQKWFRGIMDGMSLSYMTQTLFRSNQAVRYEVSFRAAERPGEIDLIISGIDLQTAFEGREQSLFLEGKAVPDVSFEDVIGAEGAKKEFIPIIRQLKDVKRYIREGMEIPRGIILDGDPGTGKTMLAKAVAHEAGLPFIQKNATEFLRKWVGEGAGVIRETFAVARKYAPCIIFIDEIDAIAKSRLGEIAKLQHTDNLVDAFLSEMDGFAHDDRAPVFLIAATNYSTQSGATDLDEAFLRRFDKKIHIDLPDLAQRELFLRRALSRYSFSSVSSEQICSLAQRSVGWSLANLAQVVRNAVRHSEDPESGTFALSDEILDEAFESFDAGEKKQFSERELRRTALHEAGHAVAAATFGVIPEYVTIVSRSNFFGYVSYSEEGKAVYTRREMQNKICIALAGRAVEMMEYGEEGVTSGAGGDLRAATRMAKQMVCSYGMEEDTLMWMPSERYAELPAVRKKIRKIIQAQMDRARQIAAEEQHKIQAVANALLVRNSLNGEQLQRILSACEEVDHE